MFDNKIKLSKEIELYITDKRLVEVAKHYDLIRYIEFDNNDKKIVNDYNYIDSKKTSGKNKKNSPHKYIATAVEAVVGIIYKENKDLNSIIKLLKQWMKLDGNNE